MLSTWIGLGIALLGGILATWGYRRHGYHELVSETPTSQVVEVDEPGTVELSGTVEPIEDEGTIDAPLSQRECLVAGWEVEEWDESGDGSSWNDVAEGYRSVPFRLDDGSGHVRVDPGRDAARAGLLSGGLDLGDLAHSITVDDVTVDFRNIPVQHQVAPDEQNPVVRRFESSVSAVHEQTGSITNLVDIGTAHGERKYHEATIEPGDDVYLLGNVTPQDGRTADQVHVRPADATVTPDGEAPFVLSTRSEDELLSATRVGLPAFAIGLLFLGFGLVMAAGLV